MNLLFAFVRFKNRILKDFEADFEETFGEKDTEWLLSILHREMMVETTEQMLTKEKYLGKSCHLCIDRQYGHLLRKNTI